MYPFDYHRPASVDEAVDLFGQADDGLFLAGGMTMIPVMKQRLAAPSDVIDLSGIGALGGIAAEGAKVTVGAMTAHADVASAPEVANTIPALAALAGGIGDPHVRNRGTIGGSIANNDPSADYPAGLVGLGATVHTPGRDIPADDFFTGMFETALEEGELVTSVSFPSAERAAYAKFANPASRYAIAAVFVAKAHDGVRVAVTGAGPGVFRVAEMEQALADDFAPGSIDAIEIAADDLNEDLHASAGYRAHLVSVLARRAVAQAM